MSANSIGVRHNTGLSPIVPISWSRVIAPVLVFLVFISFSYAGYVYLSDAVRFPVSRVEVGGEVLFLDKTRLINLTKKHTSKGFFTLNIDEIKREILAMPWVSSVQIRRYFPDRLLIDIEERKAVIQWNDNALISSEGVPFYPHQLREDNDELTYWHDYFSSWPHLRGDDTRVDEILIAYMSYQQKLKVYKLNVSGVSEDDRHSQILLLKDCSVLL